MKKLMTIAIIAIIAVGCAFVWPLQNDYSEALKINWDIELPRDANCSLEYSTNEDASSVLGDGLRYHVFSYEKQDAIKKFLEWPDSESATIYHNTYTEAVKQWLEELDVPTNWCPEYNGSRYYYTSQSDNSELIILWDCEAKLLHIVESFM